MGSLVAVRAAVLGCNDAEALALVLGIVYRTISAHILKKARLTRASGATGAVTLIQRFGSALNLNIHFHMLVLDGAYLVGTEPPVFRRITPLGDAELQALVERLAERIGRALERRGVLVRDAESSRGDTRSRAEGVFVTDVKRIASLAWSLLNPRWRLMSPSLKCAVTVVSVSPSQVPVVKPPCGCGAYRDGCGSPSIHASSFCAAVPTRYTPSERCAGFEPRATVMSKKRIKVYETFESVTIAASDATGTYRVTWHRADGPHEEFDVTPSEEESVDEAVARDLRARLGP